MTGKTQKERQLVAVIALIRNEEGEILVQTDQESAEVFGDPEQKSQRAEIPIGDPQIAQPNARQNLVQQRSFLGVAVFAGKHVDAQPQVRVEHGQRLTGQRWSDANPGTWRNWVCVEV